MEFFGESFFVCLILIAAEAAATNPGIKFVNICSDDHNFRCEDGNLISLTEIKCGSGLHACATSTNETVYGLCQGQQTCSNVGLRKMLDFYCSKSISVGVKFKCLQGTTVSCRTNICAEGSDGLQCPAGSVVHIREMSCFSGNEECLRSSYSALYLCEGSEHCDASGLKSLLPQYCKDPVVSKRNVIVQYYCVPKNQVESKCSGQNRDQILNNNFGILKSPDLDSTTIKSNRLCRWKINVQGNSKVRITIHQVNGKVTKNGCDQVVLNFSFKDCKTNLDTSKSFCNLEKTQEELMACGSVLIRSLVPAGEDYVDKFILSYEKVDPALSVSTPSGLSTCMAPSVIPVTTRPPPPKIPHRQASARPRSSPSPALITRNFGPSDGMFDYRDSSYEDGTGIEDSSRSSPLSMQLKLLILYIFFGVVILVLVVALIAVIVSYRRISTFKGRRGDSSEKTALWQQHDETPMDTFQHNNLAERSASPTSETTYAFRPNHDEVVATVHHDGISENDDFDHRISNGSGISTFLSGKRDSDFRDLINTFQTGSFAGSSVVPNNTPNERQDQNRGSGGYYEILGSGQQDAMGNGDVNNIYECIDRDTNINSNNRKSPHTQSVNSSSDDARSNDEHHLVANHDQQPLVKGQRSPSDDYHYLVNNEEYAMVRKSRKSPRPTDRGLSGESQYGNSRDNGVTVDFHPTSGPYDKKRKSATDSNSRWSKGDRWKDDV